MKSSPDPFPADPIRLSQAAKLINCDPATVFRWIATGKIRGWQKGRMWRVSKAEVLSDWSAGKPVKPHPLDRKRHPAEGMPSL